ncbi:hypothetical protein LY71_11929 [Geodermatophilus tzadiensis]|uniref:Uncharacterized protein n=1 Tax=Geodermatophilus tzadiensis TaxID=1137988 RepID=A0A2T0T652_9ACTN|nr:hypothetical protein [Geodermatophilus tzadiensis]PRY41148.1 hypothetical protein LY71_11929 [Geodermatophilus tzadiensis]
MAGDARTTPKPLLCRLGAHAWVQRHPEDERLRGPDQQVCRRCGRRRQSWDSIVPPGFLG